MALAVEPIWRSTCSKVGEEPVPLVWENPKGAKVLAIAVLL
jgi:hypothetical protein